jgi:hypothetical protein
MQLERHGWDIHAVSAGRTGAAAVAGAGLTGPGEERARGRVTRFVRA